LLWSTAMMVPVRLIFFWIVAKTLSPPPSGIGSSMVLIVCHINGASRQAAPKKSNFRFSLDVHPLETLSSIKAKVAKYYDHPVALVTLLAINGRRAMTGGRLPGGETTQTSLTSVSLWISGLFLPDHHLIR